MLMKGSRWGGGADPRRSRGQRGSGRPAPFLKDNLINASRRSGEGDGHRRLAHSSTRHPDLAQRPQVVAPEWRRAACPWSNTMIITTTASFAVSFDFTAIFPTALVLALVARVMGRRAA